MDRMIWKEKYKALEYELSDEESYIPFRCVLRKDSQLLDAWRCRCDLFGTFFVNARTPEEAKWLATLAINKECQDRINYFAKIRDNLPCLRELFDETEILEEELINAQEDFQKKAEGSNFPWRSNSE